MDSIDVTALIDAEQGGYRGQRCGTCTWLDGRPATEADSWRAEMARSTEDRPHASIHRAMQAAAKLTKATPPPSVSSLRKHRQEAHS